MGIENKPIELFLDIKPQMVLAQCKKCYSGYYVYSGIKIFADKYGIKIPHRCNDCDDYQELDKKYPHVVYELGDGIINYNYPIDKL